MMSFYVFRVLCSPLTVFMCDVSRVQVARRHEIIRSTKNAAVRAEKLEKIAKGIPTGAKKDKAIKAIGRAFYKKVYRVR